MLANTALEGYFTSIKKPNQNYIDLHGCPDLSEMWIFDSYFKLAKYFDKLDVIRVWLHSPTVKLYEELLDEVVDLYDKTQEGSYLSIEDFNFAYSASLLAKTPEDEEFETAWIIKMSKEGNSYLGRCSVWRPDSLISDFDSWSCIIPDVNIKLYPKPDL